MAWRCDCCGQPGCQCQATYYDSEDGKWLVTGCAFHHRELGREPKPDGYDAWRAERNAEQEKARQAREPVATIRLSITATLPPGATPEQVQANPYLLFGAVDLAPGGPVEDDDDGT